MKMDNQKQFPKYVWMEGLEGGGGDLLFFFKLQTLQNDFLNQLSVNELLYDH